MPERHAPDQLQPSSSRRSSSPPPSSPRPPQSVPLHFHCQPTLNPEQFELCHLGRCGHCNSCRYCRKVKDLKHDYDVIFGELPRARTTRENVSNGATHSSGSSPSPPPTNAALERIRELELENETLRSANRDLETEKVSLQQRVSDLEAHGEGEGLEEDAGNENDGEYSENEDEEGGQARAFIKREEADDEGPVAARSSCSPEVVVHVTKPELRETYERRDDIEIPQRPSDNGAKVKRKGKKREKSSMRHGVWTTEEDDKLLRGVKMRFSSRDMRRKLNLARSRGAISARKHRLGL